MKKTVFLFLFILQTFNCLPQSKVDSLRKLGRQALIDLAVKKINDPKFETSAYDRIEVKFSGEQLLVEFGLSLIFSDNTSCFYDGIVIALAGSGTSRSIEGNCDHPSYYNLSKNEKKKIDFVFDAINKENEIGDIKDKKIPEGTVMKITEKLTHYYVEVSSYSTYSHYKIEKISGKISDAAHKHYAVQNEEKDTFERIR